MLVSFHSLSVSLRRMDCSKTKETWNFSRERKELAKIDITFFASILRLILFRTLILYRECYILWLRWVLALQNTFSFEFFERSFTMQVVVLYYFSLFGQHLHLCCKIALILWKIVCSQPSEVIGYKLTINIRKMWVVPRCF